MAFQTVFKRYEIKYMLTASQKAAVLKAMQPYMEPDGYGRSTVRNVYFDTENYRLARRSLEKPDYKEKLRIRSYAQATADSIVFAELKKKYNGVVYKRRISLTEKEATAWICGKEPCPRQTQIASEIDYFMHYYGLLKPSVFLSYQREAYYSKNGDDFRVTFDENILSRQDAPSLCADVYGTKIIPDGITLMEIKCSGGIPLWMVRVLSDLHIYKTSFSKYGTAYQNIIFPKISEVKEYAMA